MDDNSQKHNNQINTTMKKVMFLTLVMSSMMTFAQQLDGYNCVFLNSHTNNQWGLDDRIKESLVKKGFSVVLSRDEIPAAPNERLATLELTYSYEVKYGGTPFVFTLTNMIGEKVFEVEGVGNTLSAKADVNRGCKRALEKMEKIPYKFDSSKTPKLPTPAISKSSWTEEQIRNYLSTSEIDAIEGIYKNVGGTYYQLAILKEEGKFFAIVMETDQTNWFVGNVKAVFESLRTNFYNTSYYEDNYSKTETISEINDNGILKIGNHSYMKLFPISKE